MSEYPCSKAFFTIVSRVGCPGGRLVVLGVALAAAPAAAGGGEACLTAAAGAVCAFGGDVGGGVAAPGVRGIVGGIPIVLAAFGFRGIPGGGGGGVAPGIGCRMGMVTVRSLACWLRLPAASGLGRGGGGGTGGTLRYPGGGDMGGRCESVIDLFLY